MANPEHVNVVRQGAAAIAEWRRQNPEGRFDLYRADLHGAHLVRVNLSGADLTDADLSEADLSDAQFLSADLYLANLSGANLSDAQLYRANLYAADLSEANLTKAYLGSTNLFWLILTEADLEGARLSYTSFAACDLSPAAGLSAVNHEAPSSIGVDTLIASFRGAGNKLTPDLETFFLGAGVPKEFLAALPEIVGAVEYYSCFISYGQPDVDFAKKLRDDLAANGVSCWLYDLDATPGDRTWKEIGRERGQADKMVVVCSAAALIRDGVLKEIEEQIDEDPDKMIPISRDNLWIEPGFRVMRGTHDLKPFLLERNYADFSDESCYGENHQRLLTALRRKAE